MGVLIVGLIGIVFIFLLGFLDRKINKGKTKNPTNEVGYDDNDPYEPGSSAWYTIGPGSND